MPFTQTWIRKFLIARWVPGPEILPGEDFPVIESWGFGAEGVVEEVNLVRSVLLETRTSQWR